MPIYTYRCKNCGAQIERHQSFDDLPLTTCPECRKKTLRKVIGPTRVIFKGSGFYATDNKSASGSKSSNSEKKEESKPKEDGKPKEATKAKEEAKPSTTSSSDSSE